MNFKKKLPVFALVLLLFAALSFATGCELAHDYQPAKVVMRSCVSDGYTLYRCTECGEEEKRDVVPAGHVTGSLVETVAPTCEEDGYSLYLCKICGAELRLDPTEKTGHTEGGTDEIEPTCKTAGYHLSTCLTCGKVLEREEIPAGRHVPGDPITKEPTCTEDGYVRVICEICDVILSDEPIAAPGHHPGGVQTTPANCVRDGERIQKCTVCGEVVNREVIPKVPHTPSPTRTVDATCTEDGLISAICSVCYARLPDTVIPSRGGHTPEPVAAVDPTCEKTGTTEGVRCAVCHLSLEGLEPIPALGHVYRDTPATTAYGHSYDLAHCDRCGDEYRHHISVDYTKLYSYNYFLEHYEKGEAMARLYAAFYTAADEFLHSARSLTPQNEDETYQSILTVTIDCESTTCQSHTEYGLTVPEAASVWAAFTHDNPQFFFLYNGYSYGTNQANSFHVLHPLKKNTTINLCVSRDYYSAAERQKILDGMDARCREMSKRMEGKTDLGTRARAIHDYVILAFDYQYIEGTRDPQTAKWAHNIVGLALGYGGVCECYAKSYLYFSYLFEINSITVYGGNHAWNMTEYDGVWYGMDLTWDDKGDSSMVYTYFGATAAVMMKAHTPYSDEWGISFQVPIPTFGTSGWIVSGSSVTLPVKRH